MKAQRVLVSLLLLICLTGCEAKVETNEKAEMSMFVQVEQGDFWKVVYHEDTKVMYVISYGAYNFGTFTILLNPDGTPMTWMGPIFSTGK